MANADRNDNDAHVLTAQTGSSYLAAHFEMSSIGLATLSRGGRFVAVNPCLCSMVGCGQAAMVGKSWSQFLSSAGAIGDNETLFNLTSDGTNPHVSEMQLIRTDGSRLDVQVVAKRVPPTSASDGYTLLEISPVAERKHKEELLQHYASMVYLVTAVINTAHDAALVISSDGLLQFANAAGHDLLQSGRLLRVTEQRIYMLYAKHQRLMQNAVKSATANRRTVEVVLPEDNSLAQWWMTVVPLNKQSQLGSAQTHRSVMLTLHNPSAKTYNVESFLQQGYGLKDAEIRLAEALVRGTTPEEYATACGLQITTIRTQLRSIFAKTGTRRQSEVVRLLSDVPRVRPQVMKAEPDELLAVDEQSTISSLSRQLHARDVLDRLTQINLGRDDLEDVLHRMLGVIREEFDADRAVVLYPCDPDSQTWSSPAQNTKPEWSTPFRKGVIVPMTENVAAILRECLNSDGAIFFDPGSQREVPPAFAEQFSIRSHVNFVLRPRTGKPWLFSLHHCTEARDYSRADQKLFTDLAQRMADTLSELIAMQRLQESERKFHDLFLHSPVGLFHADAAGAFLAVNPALVSMLGYESTQEVLDTVRGAQGCPICVKSTARADMVNALMQSADWVQLESEFRRKDGGVLSVQMRARAVRRLDGDLDYFEGFVEDASQQRQFEAKIWEKSNFDALTGLPNRHMFGDRLRQDITKARVDHRQLALLLLDLDHFKTVNETRGHEFGDRLLQAVSRRVLTCSAHTAGVARLGDDEFAITLSTEHVVHPAQDLAHDILEAVRQPFDVDGQKCYLAASMGIAVFPDDATNATAVLRSAEQALYEAKALGRGRFAFFTAAMQSSAQARQELVQDLRCALEQDEFSLVFQPIVALASGQICKAEALLRWQHPQRGNVPPAHFISAAEDSGLMLNIGEWVFRQAAYWAARWVRKGHADFCVSLNKSPVQFRDKRNATDWVRQIQSLGMQGRNICIEITEGLMLQGDASVLSELEQLRDSGVKLSIDDFGTGYSSLAYLNRFRVDSIKIDQSFVRDLATNPAHRALSKAIIVMAHELGLEVVAEGVETQAQCDFLKDAGCDYAQGYLFALPLQPLAFETLLDAGQEHDDAGGTLV